jgi:hypothetical protein
VRNLLYAGATTVGLAVLVLAGLGIASLVDDDRALSRDEAIDVIEARQPWLGAVGEITKWWAIAHRHRGEEIPSRGCEVRTRSRPYRYRCEVSFRGEAGRYRGFELTLEENKDHHFRIIGVRPRRAGPAGAPQQR